MNDKKEFIGILIEFNVLGAMREGLDLEKITASRIMTTDPSTADLNTSSDDLIQMLLLNNFSVIPSVHNKKYVGVVRAYDHGRSFVTILQCLFSDGT